MEKVIVEIFYTGKNFSAHVPILPGCISTAESLDEMKQNIREAIEFHIEGCKRDNDYLPEIFEDDYKLEFINR